MKSVVSTAHIVYPNLCHLYPWEYSHLLFHRGWSTTPWNIVRLEEESSACSIRLLIVSTGLSVMTPRVVPSRTVPNPYLQYWLPMSLNHPATFKALLLSSLSHMVINSLIPANPNPTLTPVGEILSHLRTCYIDAISSINEGLQSPITATHDASILAVLMCVENPLTYEMKARAFVSPFRPPLQGLQWLNIHSAREPNLSHQDGLCKLIGLRGGLSKIETPGLAAAAF
jgi:hypothetical protein